MLDPHVERLGRPLPFLHYDRRGYRTVDVAEGYAGWAKQYGAYERRFDLDLFEASPQLLERVKGARVVDLGCGGGRIGQWLQQEGARAITGVDLSPDMMVRAESLGIYDRLVHADLCATGLAPAAFDGAITSMALCHVPDLGAFFREARRLLRPGGLLCVVDFHPFFMFNGIPSHYTDPEKCEHIAIENYIHVPSEFFQAGAAAGLHLLDFRERFVTDEWVAAMPSYGKFLGWPITFLMLFDCEPS